MHAPKLLACAVSEVANADAYSGRATRPSGSELAADCGPCLLDSLPASDRAGARHLTLFRIGDQGGEVFTA